MIPTLEQAQTLLEQYNQDAFHLRHGKIVSGVMGWFAKELAPDEVDFWKVVGLLHDLDFEKYPEQHCIKSQEIMRENGIDERIIRATASHAYPAVDIRPEHMIGAVALMRPSKSVSDLEVKSVKKKFKTLNFAAGCSREVIQAGADMLGWPLEELIQKTILAMRSLMDEMEI